MEEKTVWNIFKKSPIPEEFCLVEIKKLFKKNVAVIMHIFAGCSYKPQGCILLESMCQS